MGTALCRRDIGRRARVGKGAGGFGPNSSQTTAQPADFMALKLIFVGALLILGRLPKKEEALFAPTPRVVKRGRTWSPDAIKRA